MANPSKRKGSRFETDVIDYLRANGHPNVERRALEGVNDRGDIAGIPSVVLELKAEARIDLPGYMRELAVEMRNARAVTGAAVVKARGKPTADAYVVMPLHHYVAHVLPALLQAEVTADAA